MTVPISGDPTISGVVLTEQAATPASPATGKRKLFVDTTGALKLVNSAGTVSAAGVATLDGVADVNAPAPTDGQVLTWDATPGEWVAAAGGMANPLTTEDDLVVAGAAGAPARLAKGADGQVLTVSPTTHHLVWATPAAGGGGSGYATVQDEGAALTARTTLNVVGPAGSADDDGSVTRLRLGDPSVLAFVRDEFCTGTNSSSGNTGELGWSFTGGGWVHGTGEANHPGIWRRSTSTTSGTVAWIALQTTANHVLLPSDTFEVVWIVRLNQSDANTTVRLGLAVSTASPPADGIYAEKADADSSWFGVCRASSAQTRSTALGASDTAWRRLRIRRLNGTTIGFTLDGGTEQTVAANVPTAVLTPVALIANSAAADKTLDVDYFHLAVALSR